jgi:GT2 family glycosyltransferase
MSGASGGPVATSVVITTRGRPDMVRDAVESVLAGELVPDEIVVVDQSDVPNFELEALTPPSCAVRYIHSSRRGTSAGRNEGVRAARGEVVVLMDDDILAEPGWLRALLAGRPSDPQAIATGRVLAAPAEGRGRIMLPASLYQLDEPAVFRGPQPVDVVCGGNAAIPREALLATGGYDERLGPGTRFPAAEDNDLAHRLLLAGCAVQHVPEAVVLHRAWRSRPELAGLRWRYARGQGAMYAKHASLADRHMLRRAGAEMGRRVRLALTSLPRAPKASALELIALGGLVAGMLDWALTVRLPAALRRLGGPRSPRGG